MLGRAWLTVPVIGTAFVVTAIASCTYHYAIRNDYSPSLVCKAGGAQGQGPKAQTATPLFKIEPNKTPNAFYITRDKTGACADIRVDGKGVWRGRAVVRVPHGAYCGYSWVSKPMVPPPAFPIPDAELDPPTLAVQQGGTTTNPSTTAPATVLVNAPLITSEEAWNQSRYEAMRMRLGVPAHVVPHADGIGVRVAVIDNASESFYADEEHEHGLHGRAVGKLIEDVACAGRQTCGVEIRNYAALPYRTDDEQVISVTSNGAGVYGTKQALAQQITLATEDWLSDRASGAGPARLVINLSLGWSGCWNRPNQSPLDNPVLIAILKATCHGALVVAAGGNREAVPGCSAGTFRPSATAEQVYPAQFLNSLRGLGGSDSGSMDSSMWSGPSHGLPAGALTADSDKVLHPSQLLCNAMGVMSPDPEPGPLLLGISGVDHTDQRLSVAAQDSSLVAFGDAVIVPDGEGWTRQLTGTSLSAATVSGIAASVWATYPSRSPADVERDLIEPAVVLPGLKPVGDSFLCNALPNTDGNLGECQDVRRVSLCGSLGHAAGQTVVCPPGIEPTEVPMAIAQQPAQKAAECPGAAATNTLAPPLLCAPPPGIVIDSMEQPWAHVGPQPPGDSCGSCIYWGRERTFTGNFETGTATGSNTGAIVFSNSHSLWSTLTSSSILKVLGSSAPTKPSSATLTYIKHTTAGNIYYYEGVVVITSTL